MKKLILSASFLFLFTAHAQAQSILQVIETELNNLTAGISQLNGSVNNFTNTFGPIASQANTNFANAVTQAGSFNTNFANAVSQANTFNTNFNNQATAFNNNFANLNTQLQQYQGIMTGIQNQMASTTQTMNSDFQEGINTVNRLTKPQNLAIMGAAAAAGAAIGATAVTMAVSGLKWGVTQFSRLVSGYYQEKRFQERLAQFNQARALYKNAKKNISILEASVDGFVTLFRAIPKSRFNLNDLLFTLNQIKTIKKEEYAVELEKFHAMTKARLVEQENKKEISSTDDFQYMSLLDRTNALGSFVTTLDSVIKESSQSANFVTTCNQLSSSLEELSQAKLDLEMSGLEMLNTLPTFIEDLKREQLKIDGYEDKLNKGDYSNAFNHAVSHGVKEVAHQSKMQIRLAVRDFNESCEGFLEQQSTRKAPIKRPLQLCKKLYELTEKQFEGEQLLKTADAKINENNHSAIEGLSRIFDQNTKKIFPRASPVFIEKFNYNVFMSLFDLIEKVYVAKQARFEINKVKQETELTTTYDFGNVYQSDLNLYADTISNALLMKKELETELTGLKRVLSSDGKSIEVVLVSPKSLKLDQMQGKTQIITNWCTQ